MKKLNKVLTKIKEVTGIEVALYFKDKLSPVNDTDAPAPNECASIQGGEIAQIGGDTYFVIRLNSLTYIVRLSGQQSTVVVELVKQLIYSVDVNDFDSLSKESKIRKLLLGELSELRRIAVKENVGKLEFFTMGFITDTHAKLVELENFLDTVKSRDDILVRIDDKFMMYYRKVSGEYNNAEDFANILYENVKEELRIDLKIAVVGEVKEFEAFESSYVRALETYELGKLFAPNANIWIHRNFVISKLMALSNKKDLKETLDSLVVSGSEGVWEDEELMVTAEAFINNSLNISETSRVLYIHRNTLMYRLDKIERETGYNLRSFSDAVVFKFISVIRTILQQN
jgi:carbohydrate diacid regulator